MSTHQEPLFFIDNAIKNAVEAAELGNFDSAYCFYAEASDALPMLLSHKNWYQVRVSRVYDYIRSLERHHGDWLSQSHYVKPFV